MMRWVGSTHGRVKKCLQNISQEAQRERKVHLGDIGISRKIILKWILKKYSMMMWTGLM
jgi:hypothetical protein